MDSDDSYSMVQLSGKHSAVPPSHVSADGVVCVCVGRPTHTGARARLPFTAIALTPNGRRLAMADRRGNIDVLDLEANTCERVDASGVSVDVCAWVHRHTHTQGGESASNTPSDVVVAGLSDGTLRCVEVEDGGQVVIRLAGHPGPIHSVAISADASMCVSASRSSAIIWATDGWSRKRSLGQEVGISAVATATHADALAVAFRDDQVLVWSTTNFGVIARLAVPEAEAGAEITCIALSHDASMLAAGAANGCVYVWDVPTQKLARVIDFPVPPTPLKQVAVLAPSALAALPQAHDAVPAATLPRLALLGEDGRLLVVELGPGVCSAVLEATQVAGSAADAFGISTDGEVLAILLRDGRVAVVDVRVAEQYRTAEPASSRASSVPDEAETMAEGQPAPGGPTGGEDAATPRQGDEAAHFEEAGGHEQEPVVEVRPATAASGAASSASAAERQPHPASTAAPRFVEEGDVAGLPETQWEQRRQRQASGFASRDRGAGNHVFRASQHASERLRAAAGGAVPAHARDRTSAPRFIAGASTDGALYEKLARALTVPRTGGRADASLLSVAKDTHRKLRGLLQVHAAFPAKYRALAWRFCLRLPSNTAGFAALTNRGSYPAWTDLEDRYPVRDRRLLIRLAKIVNALAHWSPVFGELPFLPALAFPFLKFFGNDELSAFETVMTVLVNWGRHWVETLPHPPVPLLARVHVLLQHWDASLATHLEQCGVDPSRYAWPLFRSAFSEVLPRSDWEQLWDFLVVNAHDPSLLTYAVAAYLRLIRGAILSIAASPSGPSPHPGAPYGSGAGGRTGPFGGPPVTSAGVPLLPTGEPGFSGVQAAAPFIVTPAVAEICALVRYQNPVHIRSLLRMIMEMRERTPSWAHPYPVSEADRVLPSASDGTDVLRSDGPTTRPAAPPSVRSTTGFPGISQAEPATPGLRMELGEPDAGPVHALPADHYPPFLRYPRAVIDYAIAERERIVAEEEALRRKKSVAALLERRTAELVAEEDAWRLERKLLEHAEARRAAEAEAAAALREREALVVDEEVRTQRLAGVASMQEAARQALATQRARRAAAAARAEQERAMLARTRDAILRRRVADEALTSLEVQALKRVRELNEERDVEEQDEVARAGSVQRTFAQALADELVAENWRVEDEERRVTRMVEMSQAEKTARSVSRQRQQAADETRHLVGQLEREAALLGVLRERRVRHAAEDAAAMSHGVAAKVLRADEEAIATALAESKEAAGSFAERVHGNATAYAERLRAAQESAAAEAEARLRTASERQAQHVKAIVGTRLSELAARSRAFDAGDAAAEPEIARMYASALPRAPVLPRAQTGSTGEPSQGSQARALGSTEPGDEHDAAVEQARRAVDVAKELVAREVEILRTEMEHRQHNVTRAAGEPAQRGRSSVPRDQPAARSSSAQAPKPESPAEVIEYASRPPSPPDLAAGSSQHAGTTMRPSGTSATSAAQGLAFGRVVEGASVVPTPSLGSRARGLRTQAPTAAASRAAGVRSSLMGAEDMPMTTGASLAATRYRQQGVEPARRGRSTSRARSTSAGSVRSESTASSLSQGPLDDDVPLAQAGYGLVGRDGLSAQPISAYRSDTDVGAADDEMSDAAFSRRIEAVRQRVGRAATTTRRPHDADDNDGAEPVASTMSEPGSR